MQRTSLKDRFFDPSDLNRSEIRRKTEETRFRSLEICSASMSSVAGDRKSVVPSKRGERLAANRAVSSAETSAGTKGGEEIEGRRG